MTQIPEQPEVREEPSKRPAPRAPRNHTIDILISLLLLAAVVVLAVFGLQGFRAQQLQLRTQQDWLQGQQSGLALLQNVMVTNQGALAKLIKATRSPEEEWTLGEARYFLQLASINLVVLHDVRVATVLLTAANSALMRLTSPTWLPVRRTVERDLAQLRNVSQVDVVALTTKIDALSRQIPNLALLPSQTQPADSAVNVQMKPGATPSKWEQGVSAGLQTLKKAVVIKHHPKTIQSLLPDEQRLYLVQNIQLKLAAAQWAVLHHQDAVYQKNLTAAKVLITQYFNQDTELMQRIVRSISAFQKVRLQQKVPNIEASLNALDAAMAQRAKQSR